MTLDGSKVKYFEISYNAPSAFNKDSWSSGTYRLAEGDITDWVLKCASEGPILITSIKEIK